MKCSLPTLLLLAACAPQDPGPWREQAGAWTAELRGGHQARIDANAVQYDALTLRFSAWGRPEELRLLGPAQPQLAPCLGPCPPRIQQDHADLTAWWQDWGSGLRQGWTLREAPAGSGPIQLVTEATGATPELRDGAVWLRGERLISVSGVAAQDARGRKLPADLAVRGDQLIVQVDDEGATWPIFVDPIYSTAATVYYGETTNSGFGTALNRVGDLNGDGLDELVIGSKRVNKIYVYYGGTSGPSTTADQLLTGSGEFGASFDGEVDIDCDGLDDLIVGAPGFNSSRGRVFFYPGSAGGISTTALAPVDGPEANAYLGYSVSGADDVDGDGCDDAVVGAYGTQSNSGAAGILFGAPGGPNTNQAIAIYGGAGDTLGISVSGLGDINGDVYGDVGVGACYAGSYTGYFTIHYGGADGAVTQTLPIAGDESAVLLGCPIRGAGDVNGDGLNDLVVAATQHTSFTGEVYLYLGKLGGIASTPSQTIAGYGTNYSMGSALDGNGDTDGDGLDDVIVGAVNANGGMGAAFLFPGASDGLDAQNQTALAGTESAGFFGSHAAIVGDLDGNGYDDVAVAAYGEDNSTGAVYVYLGDADEDGDGALAGEDCDDTDASVTDPFESYPDEDIDGYGDDSVVELSCFVRTGWVTTGGDCDDSSRGVNPVATELAGDEVDQNCDGVETCYVNADGDPFRTETTVESTNINCDSSGEAVGGEAGGDCDDANPDIHPGATEIWYDGIDSDCAGDDDFDQDKDGYVSDAHGGDDCDDTNTNVYPGSPDPPNDGLDRDCSGEEETPISKLSGGCAGCGGGAPSGLALLPLLLILRRQDPARNFCRPRPA